MSLQCKQLHHCLRNARQLGSSAQFTSTDLAAQEVGILTIHIRLGVHSTRWAFGNLRSIGKQETKLGRWLITIAPARLSESDRLPDLAV